MLKTWLAHPLTRGLDIDDPAVTALRRRIIRDKAFLEQIYREWYELLAAELPVGCEPVLELGAGAGFMEDYVDGLIATDVLRCPGLDLVADARCLPLTDRSLRAVLMVDVLHHVCAPRAFLREAARCVRPGGCVAMIEPWVTPWAGFVWRHLHHEPFVPRAEAWEFDSSGPLAGANLALPWMIFSRDRERFDREFPQWQATTVRPFMPFRYLLSGGVSLRSLMPGWTFPLWRAVENGLGCVAEATAMFALIVLHRTAAPDFSATGDGKSEARE